MSDCRGIGHRYGCACCAPWLWRLAGPKKGLASRRSVLAAALGGSAFALSAGGAALSGDQTGASKLRQAPKALPVAALLGLASQAGGADRIWRNGQVITMDPTVPEGTALAVSNGRVIAVGSDDEIEGLAGTQTEVTDLDGRTVLPGLVDGHGHLANTALCLGFADLQPAPAGPVNSIGSLQQTLRDHLEREGLYEGWLIGRGYDESLIEEHRHPDRDDLDAVALDIPIFCWHVSGHFATGNSLALKLAGIKDSTGDPPGGIIRRRFQTREPDGVVEEHAMDLYTDVLPRFDGERLLDLLDEAQRRYAAWGITTAQDGASADDEISLLQHAAAAGRLDLDVVAYPWVRDPEELENLPPPEGYQGGLRIGGAKLVLDGSPQGKTAWLTEPYVSPPEGWPEDYLGYPLLEDDTVDALVDKLFARGWQVMAHCNGDRSGDQFLDAVDRATGTHGAGDRRPVMIHAQTVREDQLDRMVELGVLPSFFVAHTYYWGDWHRDAVLGEERAARISPAASALARGMHFTVHNDSPVVPSDSWRLLWSVVTRTTRSGAVLGEDQRLDVPTALG
ncbi:MAG: amidohydrolase, partial [Rhodospirillaceae bacterium]|nr:amidohydrolase [Rhodospirillaceae bacterium]